MAEIAKLSRTLPHSKRRYIAPAATRVMLQIAKQRDPECSLLRQSTKMQKRLPSWNSNRMVRRGASSLTVGLPRKSLGAKRQDVELFSYNT